MEGDPFAVIEAMTIAAYATGCEHGYVYLRGEYPLAPHAPRARDRGGPRARASSARTCSARASRSTSRSARAPAPTSAARRRRSSTRSRATAASRATSRRSRSRSGLFGKPTVVNNVETLVNVLADRARAAGRRSPRSAPRARPGRSCSACPAHVARPGVYEVPFGTTLRELLELAGGVAGGRELQAVLLGGAAGGFVGPDELDLPLTFEDARAAGATLGSGVVLVLDDTVDLPRLLLRIAAFFRDESCGQCVPCRVGTVRQEEALARLRRGEPRGGGGTSSRCSPSSARRCATRRSAASARRPRARSSRRSTGSECSQR